MDAIHAVHLTYFFNQALRPCQLSKALVFLVSGVSYEASYETSFAAVLYDFALRER